MSADKNETVKVCIYVNEPHEFRIDEELSSKWSYHSIVPKEFLEKYRRVIGEYETLMNELEEYRNHTLPPEEG